MTNKEAVDTRIDALRKKHGSTLNAIYKDIKKRAKNDLEHTYFDSRDVDDYGDILNVLKHDDFHVTSCSNYRDIFVIVWDKDNNKY